MFTLPYAKSYARDAKAMSATMGDKVWQAYLLASEVHKHQKRKSGDPYISHPVAVAKLLFDIGADRDMICAALLHDSIEESNDRKSLREKIHRMFGDHVLYMVEAVSKDKSITDKLEQQSQYMEDMEHAFETDISIFFIKVSDLLHNMNTIVSLAPDRKDQWIHELKFEYIPLLSEYYHSVPIPYKGMYEKLMMSIEKVIVSYTKDPK